RWWRPGALRGARPRPPLPPAPRGGRHLARPLPPRRSHRGSTTCPPRTARRSAARGGPDPRRRARPPPPRLPGSRRRRSRRRRRSAAADRRAGLAPAARGTAGTRTNRRPGTARLARRAAEPAAGDERQVERREQARRGLTHRRDRVHETRRRDEDATHGEVPVLVPELEVAAQRRCALDDDAVALPRGP